MTSLRVTEFSLSSVDALISGVPSRSDADGSTVELMSDVDGAVCFTSLALRALAAAVMRWWGVFLVPIVGDS